MQDDYLWDPKATPDPSVTPIEEALRPFRGSPTALSFDNVTIGKPRRWPWLVAAGLLFLLAGGYTVARTAVDPWAVRSLSGAATVNRTRIDASSGSETRIAEGEWLETDSSSHAEMNIGRIGRAQFGPGSRVQLVRAEAREHRLALAHGTMYARIWAPPRFFLVQTANALAVDLGCVYSLTIDEQGAGELSVESGQVELIEGTRRALVPAGNIVSVRPGIGPGLPMPKAAAPEFQQAVRLLESALGERGALEIVLGLSSPATSITLWHLLQRVGIEDRDRVYQRLAELAPAPDGVQPAAVLALEPRALRSWKELLESSWTLESVPWWKRTWRKAWTFVLTVG